MATTARTGLLAITLAAGLAVSAVAPAVRADSHTGLVSLGHVVATPTSLAVHDGHLYVTSWGGRSLYRAEILPGGALGPATELATGFGAIGLGPLGVAVADDGRIFVADAHASAAAPGRTVGRVWRLPATGGAVASVGTVVVDELPNGRHNTNNLAIHDGRLYITNGNSTDDGVAGGDPEQPLSGTLVSIALDATGIDAGYNKTADQVPGLRLEAYGMRNLYDVAFRPGTDEAWIPTNGPDTQDPYGEDLLHVADLADADVEDMGFPGCVWRTLDDWRQSANPAVADTCDTDATDGTDHTAPVALLGLHTSANGLAWGPDRGGDGHPDLYIARFGNFFGDQVVGHDIVTVPVDADGDAGGVQPLVAAPAPLDLVFGPPGTGLYIADFSGVILLLPEAAL